MNDENMKYLKKTNSTEKVIRTEIYFTPFLVVLPIFVGILFIYDFLNRGIFEENPGFFGMFMLGVIILIVNILFDIPFLKSLRDLTRKKNGK